MVEYIYIFICSQYDICDGWGARARRRAAATRRGGTPRSYVRSYPPKKISVQLFFIIAKMLYLGNEMRRMRIILFSNKCLIFYETPVAQGH